MGKKEFGTLFIRKYPILCFREQLTTITIYNINVVVQFYPLFKFSFLLFLDIVMYDNEFETKENKI